MRKITIADAAKVMQCSMQFVRIAMQRELIDIGTAMKMSSVWTYNIVPKKLADRQGITLDEMYKIIGD